MTEKTLPVRRVVPMEDRRSLELYGNLSQAYEAEFSALTGLLPDSSGWYGIQTPPDACHDGFLLMEGEAPIGFMVVFTGTPRDVSECYILPARRRQGLGLYLAGEIFGRYPGSWQIRQIQGADRALLFWRRVLDHLVQGRYTEQLVEDPAWGLVTRQEFVFE